ncbi:hypothetical protein [Thalassovita taeanensis]|uniref:Uncharacterized protein n=1 Tax=Thalassovita taeanensis TaxID=657014 RepID=A0A1H9FB25_9RHOB|nr:hypothetical protein [Thalassovita taeanensis]SEQ35122.1 hypothetical protein SAMN04488092_10618 [Thalassovita taeanensis]
MNAAMEIHLVGLTDYQLWIAADVLEDVFDMVRNEEGAWQGDDGEEADDVIKELDRWMQPALHKRDVNNPWIVTLFGAATDEEEAVECFVVSLAPYPECELVPDDDEMDAQTVV